MGSAILSRDLPGPIFFGRGDLAGDLGVLGVTPAEKPPRRIPRCLRTAEPVGDRAALRCPLRDERARHRHHTPHRLQQLGALAAPVDACLPHRARPRCEPQRVRIARPRRLQQRHPASARRAQTAARREHLEHARRELEPRGNQMALDPRTRHRRRPGVLRVARRLAARQRQPHVIATARRPQNQRVTLGRAAQCAPHAGKHAIRASTRQPPRHQLGRARSRVRIDVERHPPDPSGRCRSHGVPARQMALEYPRVEAPIALAPLDQLARALPRWPIRAALPFPAAPDRAPLAVRADQGQRCTLRVDVVRKRVMPTCEQRIQLHRELVQLIAAPRFRAAMEACDRCHRRTCSRAPRGGPADGSDLLTRPSPFARLQHDSPAKKSRAVLGALGSPRHEAPRSHSRSFVFSEPLLTGLA